MGRSGSLWGRARRFLSISYGYRPGRSAHQAVAQAQRYVADGYTWLVDIDLEKFFDRARTAVSPV